MLRFALNRALSAGLMLLVVGTVVFSILFLVPGDPAELLLSSDGITASPDAIASLREEMGLNKPLLAQYGEFLVNALRFDFGVSLIDKASVGDTIATRLPRTIELILAGLVLAALTGIPAGTYAGLRPGRRFDRIASAVNAVLISLPGFVIGTLFIYIFAQFLRWLPAGGYTSFFTDPWLHIKQLTLPAITVGLHLFSIIFRMTRASVLEMRGNDWVRTAVAKGLSRKLVVRRHVLRNALGPVITVVGLQMGILLGSTVLIEFIYNWPGLSGYLVTAVQQRDYPSVRGVILVVSALFILINLMVELLYSMLDPRIRLE
ncbi:ABC transporter permease [Alphaproteobacteria bacterium KMM 3653]|uniref:ABC transporter permease n=1 Tax=Harenicola maris TaxID=2841044 RepID=A0AAP2G7N7_9RHOB|nr:ABC transporter permease [Harenicola maris]